MQVSHATKAAVASFDDPNLVSAAGLLPVMRLAERSGLRSLADQWLSVPTDKGANAGKKVSSLVGGMVAGADSIDDMAMLRHGGMKKIFTSCYAPSTLGSFLRSFTFGHVRQLDAVASRLLVNLAHEAPIVPAPADGEFTFVDVDDTIIEVHGHQKQGAGFGYSGIRGINALLATVSTKTSAPVVIAQRLRKGASGSPRGAARIVADAVKTVTRLPGANTAPVLLRADSAYYGFAAVNAAQRAGAQVSITARQDPAVKRAITTIPETAWTTIEYTDAIFDDSTGTWISKAEVAEVPFTAFTSRAKKDHIEGRLVVRRIPELNKKDLAHPTLFDTHRFHAFFTTTTLDTVTADQVHRRHAII
ncbi:MAG: IS1380 family transposase, partial [Leifsonia sp.]